jgi:hypothetical protein
MHPEMLASPYELDFDTLPFPAQLAIGRYPRQATHGTSVILNQ